MSQGLTCAEYTLVDLLTERAARAAIDKAWELGAIEPTDAEVVQIGAICRRGMTRIALMMREPTAPVPGHAGVAEMVEYCANAAIEVVFDLKQPEPPRLFLVP